MDISDKLKSIMKKRGLTQALLAKTAGITPTTLNRYLKRGAEPGLSIAVKLAGALGVTVDSLLSSDAEEAAFAAESVLVKRYGYIPAGPLTEEVENLEGAYVIPKALLPPGEAEYFAVKVEGKSMAPLVPEGSVAVIRVQPTLESGEIGAFALGDFTTLKKLVKKDYCVILQPINPNVEPLTFSKKEARKIRIIGKLVLVFWRP